MREKFNLRIMILVFVVLALLVCALLSVSSSLEPNEPNFEEMEMVGVPLLTDIEIRDPEIALKYGVTGYLEIIYPSDSPSLLSIDRGGEININILLHRVFLHLPQLQWWIVYTPNI
jgi:hypothetical protein